MILEKIGYSYNDLTIIPAKVSYVKSRSVCNCYYESVWKHLPIFASPMTSVVDDKNYEVFEENMILPIIPRSVNWDNRISLMQKGKWVAMSLKEFKTYFIDNVDSTLTTYGGTCKVCIDIANGHMLSLYDCCKAAKIKAQDFNYKLVLMIGNIANPETYSYICCCYGNWIDYVRVGIGGGSGCTTTSNTGVHYPQATLIDECSRIKKEYSGVDVKIVADGGIRNYNDVVKALALGADYVMIGSLFAQCVESAGVKYSRLSTCKEPMIPFPIDRYKSFETNNKGEWFGYYKDEFIQKNLEAWEKGTEEYDDREWSLKEKHYIGEMSVKFFGMASADGQKAISGEKTKTAEGITKLLPVKYTLKQWTDNMVSYIKSAMSYTSQTNLRGFIGGVKLIVNSPQEIYSVNK